MSPFVPMFGRGELCTEDPAQSWTFLTHEEIPANLLGLKAGDIVEWKPGAARRDVVRIGYRRHYFDYKKEVKELLGSPDCTRVLREFEKLIGHALERRGLDRLVARAMCARDGFGGRDRGVHVRSVGVPGYHDEYEVIGTHRAKVGVYFPPYTSRSLWDDDSELGGLDNERTIVLVNTWDYVFLSGDFQLKKRGRKAR